MEPKRLIRFGGDHFHLSKKHGSGVMLVGV